MKRRNFIQTAASSIVATAFTPLAWGSNTEFVDYPGQYQYSDKMMILFRIKNAYIHDCRNEVRRSQLQIRQDEK
jgi:hypothetical protein